MQIIILVFSAEDALELHYTLAFSICLQYLDRHSADLDIRFLLITAPFLVGTLNHLKNWLFNLTRIFRLQSQLITWGALLSFCNFNRIVDLSLSYFIKYIVTVPIVGKLCEVLSCFHFVRFKVLLQIVLVFFFLLKTVHQDFIFYYFMFVLLLMIWQLDRPIEFLVWRLTRV